MERHEIYRKLNAMQDGKALFSAATKAVLAVQQVDDSKIK